MEDQREASVGAILNRAVDVVRGSSKEVAIFVVAIGGLVAVGSAVSLTTTAAMEFSAGWDTEIATSAWGPLFDIFLNVVSIVAGFLLMRRYLDANGRHVGDGRFWPYFGMAILSILAIIVGLLFLVVPGIILIVRWTAASGFLISQNRGVTESLGASFEATKGSSWQIFFAAIVLLLGLAIASVVIGGIFAIFSLTVVGYLSAFLEALSNAIFLAFGIAVFLELTDGNTDIRDVFE